MWKFFRQPDDFRQQLISLNFSVFNTNSSPTSAEGGFSALGAGQSEYPQ